MKCVITIEDTPTGVSFRGDAVHNGTLDHITQSIAFMLMAQIQHRIQQMNHTHILRVSDEDDVTH